MSAHGCRISMPRQTPSGSWPRSFDVPWKRCSQPGLRPDRPIVPPKPRSGAASPAPSGWPNSPQRFRTDEGLRRPLRRSEIGSAKPTSLPHARGRRPYGAPSHLVRSMRRPRAGCVPDLPVRREWQPRLTPRILDICQNLRCDGNAEGVEPQATPEVRRHGCRHVQGCHIGRRMLVPELLERVRDETQAERIPVTAWDADRSGNREPSDRPVPSARPAHRSSTGASEVP